MRGFRIVRIRISQIILHRIKKEYVRDRRDLSNNTRFSNRGCLNNRDSTVVVRSDDVLSGDTVTVIVFIIAI